MYETQTCDFYECDDVAAYAGQYVCGDEMRVPLYADPTDTSFYCERHGQHLARLVIVGWAA